MSNTITNGKDATEWATSIPPDRDEAACRRVRSYCSAILNEFDTNPARSADARLFMQLIVAELETKLV